MSDHLLRSAIEAAEVVQRRELSSVRRSSGLFTKMTRPMTFAELLADVIGGYEAPPI